MKKEVSAGGVVYTSLGEQQRILLILDVFDQWSLPKGHIELGETPQQAALREIEEEVGLKGEIVDDLGETHYQYRRDSQTIDKVVYYYLVRTPSSELRLAAGEVLDARWVVPERALELSSYPNNRLVIERAVGILQKLRLR